MIFLFFILSLKAEILSKVFTKVASSLKNLKYLMIGLGLSSEVLIFCSVSVIYFMYSVELIFN